MFTINSCKLKYLSTKYGFSFLFVTFKIHVSMNCKSLTIIHENCFNFKLLPQAYFISFIAKNKTIIAKEPKCLLFVKAAVQRFIKIITGLPTGNKSKLENFK